MKINNFNKYKKVQLIAKTVLDEIKDYINYESTEEEITENCKMLLLKYGIDQTWYYNCPALVLLGSRSCLSVSGREYVPANEKVGTENLITIDLSPIDGEIWGDCARSYVFENNKVVDNNEIKNTDLKEGLEIEKRLHEYFFNFVKPGMTFETIYQEMNKYINILGYKNIDFMGNTGHTVEINRNDRQYFEKVNTKIVPEDKLFTFEPHIKKIGGEWGFKHENIYYFEKRKVEVL
jgi:Xaa-Pro aminopeptidase